MGTGTRPLLLVDVDGVLSLFGFEPPAPAGVVWTTVDGLPHALSRPAGARLARLSGTFDCAWCTGGRSARRSSSRACSGCPAAGRT